MSVTYEQAVKEGRELVERSSTDQWRLAELTYEQLEKGVTAKQWADDIKVTTSYVYRLFKIWQLHSLSDDVHKPKFSEAYNEVSPASARPTQSETREEKIKTAKEALSNPETIPEILGDPYVHDVVRQEMARIKEEADQPDIFDFQNLTTKIQYHLDEIDKNLDKVDQISVHDRNIVADSLTKIATRSSGLSDIMRSTKNLDDEWEAFA